MTSAEHDQADRRKEALLLVSYNLAKLNLHITTSRRILNDLRMLRRLLLAERGLSIDEDPGVETGLTDGLPGFTQPGVGQNGTAPQVGVPKLCVACSRLSPIPRQSKDTPRTSRKSAPVAGFRVSAS